MEVKVYEYKNCSTCRKALKFLDAQKISYERLPIVERPPSLAELKRMLKHVKERGGSVRNLFNTSGQQYRDLRVAEKLKAGLGDDEALRLLSANGKLVKRPFLLTKESGVVGFNESEWKELLKKFA